MAGVQTRQLHMQAGWSQLAEEGRWQDHSGDAREAEGALYAYKFSQLQCDVGRFPLVSVVLETVIPTSPPTSQVGNKEALNCYYAHADQEDQLQVRLLACLGSDL
jgi:hypothetical protein